MPCHITFDKVKKLKMILEMMKRKDKNFEFPKCTAIEDEDDLLCTFLYRSSEQRLF